jgi:hypothetical protein
MRRRFLLALELIIVAVLVLITRCANYRDVFANAQIYFVDADCYARMTRARTCFQQPGTILRHHDFENFPEGTSPHTTAPFDYLIVALAEIVAAFSRESLDLAGALISPLLAVATGIFLCWWTRRIEMRFRFALLGLFAVSPILAHGTALGRPDHQSLLIALIAVALCAEWTMRILEDRAPPDPSASRSSVLQRSIRSWNLVCGASWALALWVSLYEPSVLLALVLLTAFATRKRIGSPIKRIAFVLVGIVAILIERRFPSWPARELFWSLKNWTGSIGELSPVPFFSRVWFEWCSWLLVLTPVLFWRNRRDQQTPLFVIVLLLVTFGLTLMQARWAYFLALIFALLAPEILGFIRKPLIAAAIFLCALFPVAQAWDASLAEAAKTTRAENQSEQIELRTMASEIDGPLLAPWWFSPALVYWSHQPAVAGSSHESISGIIDCASFYAATEPESAAEICRRRQVKWVVSYDSDRVAENSAGILGHSIDAGSLCYVLNRHSNAAPSFLKLVGQTARFKLYRVEGL